MSDDDVQMERGRGRPPKMRTCESCSTERMARDFPHGEATSCKHCRKMGIGIIAQNIRFLMPGYTRAQELLQDVEGAATLQSVIASIIGGFSRCGCCFTGEHMRDVAGQSFCAVCATQISACGRCETHKSRVFFPTLTSNTVPHVPIEIWQLFEAPDLRRREIAPRVENEPADDP